MRVPLDIWALMEMDLALRSARLSCRVRSCIFSRAAGWWLTANLRLNIRKHSIKPGVLIDAVDAAEMEVRRDDFTN